MYFELGSAIDVISERGHSEWKGQLALIFVKPFYARHGLRIEQDNLVILATTYSLRILPNTFAQQCSYHPLQRYTSSYGYR
jgi:hypothetical protein